MRVLSRLFRRLFLRYLEEAFDTGRLHFGGALNPLTERHRFAAHLAPARKTEWVVYAKPPFGGPQQVLDYVGRYTHRVAISDNRMVDLDAGHVRFRYRKSRTGQPSVATVTLSAPEFIRRFLLHVLPTGFHRIRYFGLFGNRHRTAKLARCRQLLGMVPPRPVAAAPTIVIATKRSPKSRCARVDLRRRTHETGRNPVARRHAANHHRYVMTRPMACAPTPHTAYDGTRLSRAPDARRRRRLSTSSGSWQNVIRGVPSCSRPIRPRRPAWAH